MNTHEGLKISLVIPCFNEQDAIHSVLTNGIQDLQQQNWRLNQDFEILVVDDASTDSSAKFLEAFTQIRVIRNQKKLGYGGAIKAGISNARATWVAYADMDGTYPIGKLPKMFQVAQASQASLINGCRWSKDSKMPWIRRLGNGIYRLMISILYSAKLSDPCSGLKLFKKTDFVQYRNYPNDLSFSLAQSVDCGLRRLSVIEIPVPYADRIGESKLQEWKDGYRFFKLLLLARFSKNALSG